MNRIYNAEYYESEHHAFVKGNGVSYSERERMYPFFEQIAEKIIKNYAPKTVLDVGCAYGYLVEALRCRGVEAYGIDISEYAIGVTNLYLKNGITYFCMAIIGCIPWKRVINALGYEIKYRKVFKEIWIVAVFFISVCMVLESNYSPFIYFNF